MNLYSSNSYFYTKTFNSRKEWLISREKTIGGSEASSLIGINKYQSLRDLWRKKKKGVVEEVDNEAVRYGNDCEPILRELFKIKHPNLVVQYKENTTMYSIEYDYMHYSADGLIWDGERAGILEIKTSFIRNSEMSNEWKERIPDSYYIQILHGLICTGFEFVNLIAELRYIDGNSSIRQYHIERLEVLDDIEYLLRKERENWEKYFLSNLEPPIIVKI